MRIKSNQFHKKQAKTVPALSAIASHRRPRLACFSEMCSDASPPTKCKRLSKLPAGDARKAAIAELKLKAEVSLRFCLYF